MANAKTPKAAEGKELAVVGGTDNSKSGPVDVVEPPKTLHAYEKVVETNIVKGAGPWRIAADALMAIKQHKLWKKAKDANGEKYASFVIYAEDRFGIKKTYAYDLVKAASRKPKALTEGAARESMKAAPAPLPAWDAAARIDKAYASFEDRAGNLRDRAIDDEAFVASYDDLVRQLGTLVRAFVAKHPEPIEGTATEIPEKE